MNTNAVDRPRLAATLGRPELARLLAALRRRLELGRPLTGTLTLRDATSPERAACDELFGRRATRGSTLAIDLDSLSAQLAAAGICNDLASAVESLVGPTINLRALAADEAASWSAIWQDARAAFACHPILVRWLEGMERDGFVKRLCRTPQAASAVLRELARLAESLPAAGEPLAALAARLYGNAHALDPGSPLATLAVRAAAWIGAVMLDDNAESRRAAWASVGVMCDELSTPALVLNLPASGDTVLGSVLRAGAAAGEPLHVSLRQLLRYPLSNDTVLCERVISVCENPTIVAMAVARYGTKCAPLVCVNGQFTTPSLVLLRQLRCARARLRYHGDFDPPGLAIARRVFAESGASPWKFGEAEYVAAPKGVTFAEDPGPTPWSPGLENAMQRERRVAHEEAVFEDLARDLLETP